MKLIITLLNIYLNKNKYNICLLLFLFLFLYLYEIISLSIGLFFICFALILLFLNIKIYKKIKKDDAIVITGCDCGLGYSLALHCKINLNLQVIAGVHSIKSVGAQELVKYGIKIISIELTDLESIQKFTNSIENYLKTNKYNLRGLVNNAGMMIFGEFEWQTDEQIINQIQVNLLGTTRLTKSMIPILREHKSRLIIVTSHCAIESLPGVAIYGATKSALSAWTTSLRIELKKSNIDVINFIPGSFVESSNILFRQKKYFNDMDYSMKLETKKFYQDYFQRYSKYLTSFIQDNSLKKINKPELYKIFNDLLMENNPSAVYKCEPWRYWFYFILFKISPTIIRDYFVVKFVQLPPWQIK